MKRSLVAAAMISLALSGHAWAQSGPDGNGAGGITRGSGSTGAPIIGGPLPRFTGAVADPAAHPTKGSTAAPELPQTNGVMSVGVPLLNLPPPSKLGIRE